MNIQRPDTGLVKIRLFLEGIEVEFSSISIVEQENNYPTATIILPEGGAGLRLLAGTIVQVVALLNNSGGAYSYREMLQVGNLNESEYIIFEGEVAGYAYQRGVSGSMLSVQAYSLLYRTQFAQVKPADAICVKGDDEAFMKTRILLHTENPSENKDINTYSKSIKTEDNVLVVDGNKSDLAMLSTLTDLNSEMVQYLKEESPGGVGNYFPLLRSFNTHFETSDLFYGISSLSFRLSPSMFIFPNPGTHSATRVKYTGQLIQKMTTLSGKDLMNSTENLYYKDFIEQIRNGLNYKFLAPASFPAADYFYVNNYKGYHPLRLIYIPEIESGPPALCNVFFPEQVQALNYQRKMLDEPTRLIASMRYGIAPENTSLPSWMEPIIVIPDVALVSNEKDEEGFTPIRSTFTEEECYRGILPKHGNFNGVLCQLMAAEAGKIDKKVYPNKTYYNSLDPNKYSASTVVPLLREFALTQYAYSKYAARVVNMQTDWSPYRMVGLPGMVFNIGEPTLVGVVQTIATEFSAEGAAKSTVTLRNCRVIFDEEENSVFNKLSTDTITEEYNKDGVLVKKVTHNPIKKEKTDLSYYTLNDLSQETLQGVNNMIYFAPLYSFDTIGEDVYIYLLYGDQSPMHRFADISATAKPENFWNEFSYIKSITVSKHYEGSILRYVKQQDPVSNNIVYHPNITMELAKSGNIGIEFNSNNQGEIDKIVEKLPKEFKYNKLLHLAISAFKRDYKSIVVNNGNNEEEHISNKGPIYQYIDYINWRRLNKFSDYLNFIGAYNDPLFLYADVKDLNYILNKDEKKNKVPTTEIRKKIVAMSETFNQQMGSLSDSTIVTLRVKRNSYASTVIWILNKQKYIDGLIAKGIKATPVELQEIKNYENERANHNLRLEKINKVIADIDALLSEAGDIDLRNTKLDDLINNYVRTDKCLFKPYNLTRKAHVYFIFNKNKKQVEAWV